MNTDKRRFWLKPQIRLSSQLAGTTLAIVSALPLFAVEPPIVGSWHGVFHAMPDPGDDRMRDRIYRFELVVSVKGGKIVGTFKNMSTGKPAIPITKGECRDKVCCFEVLDDPYEDGVNTWCVTPKGDSFVGMRNGGEMTSSGMGIGARLFHVAGHRLRSSH